MCISLLLNKGNHCSDDFGSSIAVYFLEAINNSMRIDWKELNRDLQ